MNQNQPLPVFQNYIDGDDHLYSAAYTYGFHRAQKQLMDWFTKAGFTVDADSFLQNQIDDSPLRLFTDDHNVFIGEAMENIFVYVIEIAIPVAVGYPFSADHMEKELAAFNELLPTGHEIDVIECDNFGDNHCDIWVTTRFAEHDLDSDGYEMKILTVLDAATRLADSL